MTDIHTWCVKMGKFKISRSRKIDDILYISFDDTEEIKLVVHSGGIIIGDNIDEEPPTSGVLTIQSEDKGIVFPRLTNDKMRSMMKVVPGTVVFNITNDKFYGFTDISGWKEL